MDLIFKDQFIDKWKNDFNGVELSICCDYMDEEGQVEMVSTPTDQQCIFVVLGKVRKGKSL